MTMLMLSGSHVPLDRDVIFLAEAGEEGSTRVGIQFMVNQHFAAIDAEYLPRGDRRRRAQGRPGALRRRADDGEGAARHRAYRARGGRAWLGAARIAMRSCGSGARSTAVGDWRPPVRLNETTRAYFTRLAQMSSGAEAQRYRDVLDPEEGGGRGRILPR